MPVSTNPQQNPKGPKIEIRSAPLPTLWQRLREIKKKDLAFILAGLSVLVLAPVAQHMALKPGEDGSLEPGFATRDGSSAGGGAGGAEGSAPFEPGLGGFAPGQAPGGGAEAITPLASRDPSSLLMPPQGPPAPPKVSQADTVRDALNRALRSSGSQAVEKVGLPRPSPRLASTLRGLAALAGAGATGAAPVTPGGGGSASAVLENAASQPNKPVMKSFTGGLAPSDFKGAARGNVGGSDSIEGLRTQAEKAAGHMGTGASASEELTGAAKDSAISGGGTSSAGLGQGGEGENKAHSGNNIPGGKYEIGESLAFQMAKQRAQKEMDLAFKKKETLEMIPYDAQKKFMEMTMDKVVGDGFLKGVGEMVGSYMKGDNPYAPKVSRYFCLNKGVGDGPPTQNTIDKESMGRCPVEDLGGGRKKVCLAGGEKGALCSDKCYVCDDLKADKGSDPYETAKKGDATKDSQKTSDQPQFGKSKDELAAAAANRDNPMREESGQLSGAMQNGQDAQALDQKASASLEDIRSKLFEPLVKARAAVVSGAALAGPGPANSDTFDSLQKAAAAAAEAQKAGKPEAQVQAMKEAHKRLDAKLMDLQVQLQDAIAGLETAPEAVQKVKEDLAAARKQIDTGLAAISSARGKAEEKKVDGNKFVQDPEDKLKREKKRNEDLQREASDWAQVVADAPGARLAAYGGAGDGSAVTVVRKGLASAVSKPAAELGASAQQIGALSQQLAAETKKVKDVFPKVFEAESTAKGH